MVILKKIISVLANISYVLIAIYGVLVIPKVFGITPVVVLSGSMEPTYSVGDLLYYKKVDRELEVGDVITYRLDDALVTHRIVDIQGSEYITQGDANEARDLNPVLQDSIVGIPVFSIPMIGYYIYFVNNNLYLVGIVVVILLSEFLLSNIKTFDIDKNEKRKEYEDEEK